MFRKSLSKLGAALSRAPRQSRMAQNRFNMLAMHLPKPVQIRYNSSQSDRADASKAGNSEIASKTAELKMDSPQLMIAFTCKVCDTRSSHTFSKQSYTKGSVLIQCPGCKNRHLIADNLNVFRDEKVNLEDLLRAKGESVAQSTDDLAFEDIPVSLRETLGRYAKDAPEEYQQKDPGSQYLDSGKKD